MKMRVLGIQNVDYVSKRTGNPVKGVTLHCAFKDAQVDGEMVDGVFVSDSLEISAIANVRVGSLIDVTYNRRGYVADVALLPPEK